MDVDHCGAGAISLSTRAASVANGTADGDVFPYAERIADKHCYTFANLNLDADSVAHTSPHVDAHLHADACAAARPGRAA